MSLILPIKTFVGSGSSLSSVSFLTSVNVSATTITIPATVIDGDFAVLFDHAGGSSMPSDVTPSGWTSHANLAGSVSTAADFRYRASYRLLTTALAGTSVTGMVSTGFLSSKIMLVFRPNIPAFTLTLKDPATEFTSSDPASQTLTSGSGTNPLVSFGYVGSYADSPVFSTASPSFDSQITQGTNSRAGYKIYNSSPSNHTIDMNDLGNHNCLSTFYIEVS